MKKNPSDDYLKEAEELLGDISSDEDVSDSAFCELLDEIESMFAGARRAKEEEMRG